MLVLALGIDAASCRAGVFDHAGRHVPGTICHKPVQVRRDAGGRADADPAELVREAEACIAHALATLARDPKRAGMNVAAVAVAAAGGDLIGVDAAGEPTTPAIAAADRRCATEADALAGEGRAAATGWPAKLVWLRRSDAKLWKRTACWRSPADWLLQRWLGPIGCSPALASASGLFEPGRSAWDPRAQARCEIGPHALAPADDEPLSTPDPLAERWPALRGASWYPALDTLTAIALGLGAQRPGQTALLLGASATVLSMTSAGARPAAGISLRRLDRQRLLQAGVVRNADSLRAWCLRELRLPTDAADLERALAERAAATNERLSAVPLWRFEDGGEGAGGAITGIGPDSTALDLLAAVTEAGRHHLAAAIDRMAGARIPVAASSGQRSLHEWQALADVCGRAIHLHDEPEPALRGAALRAVERLDGATRPPTPAHVVAPRPAEVRHHAVRRRELASLAAALRPPTRHKHHR